jgi:hypothetical protein
MPKKTQRMVYAKAQSVFELIDPDGHIYILQAQDAQFPIESLAKLGEQMKQLPKGWQYRTRALTEDLVVWFWFWVPAEAHSFCARISPHKS